MSDILAKLHNEYVGTGDIPGSSSHWKEYSSQFVFELDDDGVPVVLKGLGFGDVEAKDRLRKLAKESLSFIRTIVSTFALKNWGLVRTGRDVTHAMGLAYAQDAWRQGNDPRVVERSWCNP